jgi:hypothetical protein
VDDWEPITRGNIVVPENQPVAGTITAETTLSRTPDDHWRRAFQKPSGVSESVLLSWQHPRLTGDKVVIEVSKSEDLQGMVNYVDGAIEWANQWYAGNVLPHLRAETLRRAEKATKRQADLAKARQIAEGL